VRALSIPDEFIDHDSQAGQLAYCGLDRNGILAAAQKLVTHTSQARISEKS
jgi:deoxyxylulose-5-phosphate synthase